MTHSREFKPMTLEVIERLIKSNRALEKQAEVNYSQTAPICYGDHMDILETCRSALKVIEALKTMNVVCNHKPDGWEKVYAAFKPFRSEE